MPVSPVPCAPGDGGTPGTCACAPSIASTPLCRADGTTVLVVIRSECVDCGDPAADPAAIGWIDPVTGTYTAGAVPADVGPCTLGCSCSPSIATAPMCLADGTSILVVVRSECADCDTPAPDPVVVGWINPTTGLFTPGAAPADAGACTTDCIDTICRQRCDDTDGDGQPDATYSELWCIGADGTAELVLIYQDDPSVPYVPTAPVDCTYGCPDHETVMLCDGSGPFLRRYVFLNGTESYEDVALDGQTPHVVIGTVGVCAGTDGGTSPCAEQTTPAATLGLCLADGTPIAVVVTRDCAGLVTLDGWINLTTGTFSAGAPPAGAAGCGDSRAFELAGLLCDVDPATGDVLGLVLVEYEYNPDGSLSSVRLVDPGTGATYTLQGELSICPGGTGTPAADLDLTVLCDVQADGTAVPFLRDYRRDATTGQINGHTDYGLDGTPYAATGTVGICSPAAEECRNASTLLLCDLPTDGDPAPTVTDTPGAPYYPYTTGVAMAGAQTLWDGGTLTFPDAAGPQPGTGGTVRTAAAVIQAPRPVCDAGAAHVTVHVDVTQLGPDTGCRVTGFLGLYNGPGDANRVALALAPPNTPVGWSGTLTAEADVPAADLAAGNIAVLVAFDAYDDSGAACPPPRRTGWQLSQFDTTVVYDQTGCAAQFLRNVTTDCETGAVVSVTDTTLDGTPYTVTGEAGQCTAAGGACCPEQPCPAQNIVEACRCDDTDADGVADLGYVELLAVDCTGTLTSLGTYTEGLTGPYTPVAPVDCGPGDEEGAEPAFGVQARRVELTAGQTWDAATWPTLQSVTAVAHGGTGTITTAEGASTLHTGEAATWSVGRDADALLTGPLTIAADSGTVTVSYTIGVTL
ncbi:hypothetical protein OOK58_42950 [Streptomyces sp. NBC_01728]|uniref:hypothetical protein n=1 Tax=unclassified Streptomyces TaxID=2593676 RepID=UPI00225A05FD|nr:MULTISPECIES: hypothetical protein [unclassified Streptomyces]MCX4458671.1 hypothetical protein [Streptomyces sp. NBC_01719]MCX4498028.1 hypothetical protein [Streptomyces sp. NBC_01728]